MAKALDRTYAVQDARAIDVGVLETFQKAARAAAPKLDTATP